MVHLSRTSPSLCVYGRKRMEVVSKPHLTPIIYVAALLKMFT